MSADGDFLRSCRAIAEDAAEKVAALTYGSGCPAEIRQVFADAATAVSEADRARDRWLWG